MIVGGVFGYVWGDGCDSNEGWWLNTNAIWGRRKCILDSRIIIAEVLSYKSPFLT